MLRLSGNQLKIIAMVTMTIDHIGMLLFPRVLLLRIIGRLSMPIYAYMIAEGCRHTRDRKKYLLRLLGLGALCQVVYFAAMGSLYQCILITFSLSVMLCCLGDHALGTGRWGPLLLGCLTVFFLCTVLPDLLRSTDYGIDYGLWGVLLPVLVYYGKDRRQKLALFTLGLTLLGLDYGYIQWYALGAIPLVALYSGEKGRHSLGRLFYFYYPAHLVALEGLRLLQH